MFQRTVTMTDIQILITAVNESQLDAQTKREMRAKLDDWQTARMTHRNMVILANNK